MWQLIVRLLLIIFVTLFSVPLIRLYVFKLICNAISFLDVWVKWIGIGTIETSVYSIPTNRSTYLQFTSFLSNTTNNPWLSANWSGVNSCFFHSDFSNKATDFLGYFQNGGYQYILLSCQYELVFFVHKLKLLSYRTVLSNANDCYVFLELLWYHLKILVTWSYFWIQLCEHCMYVDLS